MNYTTLPNNYGEASCINLQKNVKTASLINIISLAIMSVMFALALIFLPFATFFEQHFVLKMIVSLFGCFLYMFLHEFVHGAFFEIFSGKRSTYGISLLYTFTKNDAFFDKRSYRLALLAPLFFWFFVIIGVMIIVPINWFWSVYLIQIFNVASSVGDVYVCIKLRKLPNDVLVQDSGYKKQFYIKQKQEVNNG